MVAVLTAGPALASPQPAFLGASEARQEAERAAAAGGSWEGRGGRAARGPAGAGHRLEAEGAGADPGSGLQAGRLRASPTFHQSKTAQQSRYATEPRTCWERSAGGGDCGKAEPIGTEDPRPSAVMDSRVRANGGVLDSKKAGLARWV